MQYYICFRFELPMYTSGIKNMILWNMWKQVNTRSKTIRFTIQPYRNVPQINILNQALHIEILTFYIN